MKEKLKKYNITMAMIAEWFELASVDVLYATSAKEKYLRVTEKIVEHILSEVRKKLD